MDAVDERLLAATCDGCRRYRPGRRSNCEINECLRPRSVATTYTETIVEWSRRMFDGGRCRMRVQR